MGAQKFAKVRFGGHAESLVFIESNPQLPSATKSLNRFKSSRAHHHFVAGQPEAAASKEGGTPLQRKPLVFY